MEFGAPVWTTGHFDRVSALDDLGIESVGAGLLRRLIPGVVQTTPNAGYYAYYPYLLAKWESTSESTARADFKPFFRRQEAAYAVACSLHGHRGSLSGIQGSNSAIDAIRVSGDAFDLRALADRYMDSPYGGYGLFYARVLEDMQLTRIGARAYVDRASDRGKVLATAFAASFEDTRYFKEFFDADIVPRDVLEELGERTCLCSIPDSPVHTPLVDVFFGEPLDDPVWDDRRRTRIESLAIFLEFHRQRTEGDTADRLDFRVTLAQGAFPDGTPLRTSFPERQASWRAYQLRECETVVLTTMWSRYLRRLGELDPISHDALAADLVAAADWGEAELDPGMRLADAIEAAVRLLPTGGDIVAAAHRASVDQRDDVGTALAADLRVLLALVPHIASDERGFAELVDEGGRGRWSLSHLRAWLDVRADVPVAGVLEGLLDEIHFQHMRVGLGKVSPTDYRDPFCFSDDDNILRLIRQDEPFWTAARFEVVNHLLWTLGLFTAPSGDVRLTSLGESTLRRVNGDA